MIKKIETFSTIVDEVWFKIEVVSDTIIEVTDDEGSIEVTPKALTISILDQKVNISELLNNKEVNEKVIDLTIDELLARDILGDYDESE